MAFNTGNPIGSTDARDLSDNAQNFDQAINGPSATWVDRLDNTRISLRGQIGYTGTGSGGAIQSYTSGLVLSGYNVIILYSGEFYRPSASATLPYTTTATLPDVDSNLVSVGDANLRQDLAGDPADGLGAALINGAVIHVTNVSDLEALNGISGDQASLNGADNYEVSQWGIGSSLWEFSSSDLSSEVTQDPIQTRYVAPESSSTGDSGAWVNLTPLEMAANGVGLNFMQQLNSNQRDVFMLVQGDSTSNSEDEWAWYVFNYLAYAFPSYTVLVYQWNESIADYNSPTVEGTGTGVNTLHLYNGSVSGATSEYFIYKYRPAVYAGRAFDLILWNYGHNQGGGSVISILSRERALSDMAQPLSQLIQDQPAAEIALTIQNLWGDGQPQSSVHADVINTLHRLYGCPIIDVRSAFLWKKNNGNINDWLRDGLHPNETGSRVWAQIVINALVNPKKQLVTIRNSLADTSRSLFPNSHFIQWDWATSKPKNWITRLATTTRDEETFETGSWSVKLEGTGAAGSIGSMSIPMGEMLDGLNTSYGVTFMARVYISSQRSTNLASTLDFISDVGAIRSSGRASAGRPQLQDGWNWKYLYIPREALLGATEMEFFVWVGETGDICWIDRVNVVEGRLPKEVEFATDETFLDYYYDENVTTNANNTVTVSGDSVTHNSTVSGESSRWYINLYGLEIGEQYTFTWTSSDAGTAGGVVYRPKLNGATGPGAALQADLSIGSFSFRAVNRRGSLDIFQADGAVPYTLENILVVKG